MSSPSGASSPESLPDLCSPIPSKEKSPEKETDKQPQPGTSSASEPKPSSR